MPAYFPTVKPSYEGEDGAVNLIKDLAQLRECNNQIKYLDLREDGIKCSQDVSRKIYYSVERGNMDAISLALAMIYFMERKDISHINRIGIITGYIDSNEMPEFNTFYEHLMRGDINTAEENPELDKFVDWLASEDVRVYTSSWCPVCSEQKKRLGKNGFVITVDCAGSPAPEECECIDKVPTWCVDGKYYVGLKTIEELKDLTHYDENR